jgi:flavin reductase (DIM6/NTAB) family NADH-FMN oxidoreductase RutF
VLSEGQDDTCVRLSSKEGDRFADVEWEVGPGRSVFIRDSSAWLDCSLYQEVLAGDHTIALLKIYGLRAAPNIPPLIFHGSRFRRMAAILRTWKCSSRTGASGSPACGTQRPHGTDPRAESLWITLEPYAAAAPRPAGKRHG